MLSATRWTLGAKLEDLRLTGGGSNSGTGNGLANAITGNGGNNRLHGRAGDDNLSGRSGNDTLIGGSGNDSLEGGEGADRFYFHTALDAATNVDEILDFSVEDDTIFLKRTIFTEIGASGTLDADPFHMGAEAEDAEDRILYDSGTGELFYDADGSSDGEAILFATVDPWMALTHADFSAYI